MPNKHFCQGPHVMNKTTDRFLKSRGVIRGRYAYADSHRTPTHGVAVQMVVMFIFVVKHASLMVIITWKTLNMVDRLSLSDTDERAMVMPRLRMMSLGGVQNILFKGLTMDS